MKAFNHLIKKSKNINSLFIQLKNKPSPILKAEHNFLAIIDKFRELKEQEINANMKVYALLDIILFSPKDLSLIQLKNLISLYLACNIQNQFYWNFLYQVIQENNYITKIKAKPKKQKNRELFIDLIKTFSLTSYNNEELWKDFEYIAKNSYKKLKLEDLESLILSFIYKSRGNEKLMSKLIEYSKMESKNSDVIVNYLLGISKNYRNFDIYHKLINYSVYDISDKILQIENELGKNKILKSIHDINLIFTILPTYYRLIHIDKSYKHTERYNKHTLKKFTNNLEQILVSYLELSKIKVNDFNNLALILKISYNNKIRLSIKSKFILNYFIKVISNNKEIIENFNLLHYLAFFVHKNINKNKLKGIIGNNQDLWESFIDKMHLMTISDKIELFKVLVHFNINYFKIWLYIQSMLRNELEVKYYQNINKNFDNKDINKEINAVCRKNDIFLREIEDSLDELITKLKSLVEIRNVITTNNFYLKDSIVLPFYYFLDNEINKINILLSNSDKECDSSNKLRYKAKTGYYADLSKNI